MEPVCDQNESARRAAQAHQKNSERNQESPFHIDAQSSYMIFGAYPPGWRRCLCTQCVCNVGGAAAVGQSLAPQHHVLNCSGWQEISLLFAESPNMFIGQLRNWTWQPAGMHPGWARLRITMCVAQQSSQHKSWAWPLAQFSNLQHLVTLRSAQYHSR